VQFYFRLLMTKGLGLDLNDPVLKNTPERVARMYCQEFFCGVNCEFEDFQMDPNTDSYDQIIISDEIYFVSMCAHHFLPFSGYGYFAYIPGEHIIGASKMSRIINHYAKRPQKQETLCHEALRCFAEKVKPIGAMVALFGTHGCMSCRGVKQTESKLLTSAVMGCFSEPSIKNEALSLISISRTK